MRYSIRNIFRTRRRFEASLNRVVSAASRLSGTPYVVFADWNYRRILANWLAFARRSGVTNTLVIVFDRRLLRALKNEGVFCVWAPMKQGKGFLWWRLLVFQALCESGIDFIHCDADAILLRNPESQLERFPEADLILSPGTVHPEEIARKHKFVGCMGFFLLRSTRDSRSMLSEAISLIPANLTDQASVNVALFRRVSEWEGLGQDWANVTHRGLPFIVNSEPIRSVRSEEIRVVILPHTQFQRYFLGHELEPYVVHPLANQIAGTKIETLIKFGLWDQSVAY